MFESFSVKRFGDKLRTLRHTRKLSLKGLASELGYTSHGYISELETGKKQPTIEFVLKVSRYFNISTDQLLKDELDINPGDKDLS